MAIISQVALAMQLVLTETADQLAQETGLIKRQRKLSGASFAQTLVFGWRSNPEATLDERAQTATAIGVLLTPEAVVQRFTEAASRFLQRILDASIQQVISAKPVAIEVLKRFCGVDLLDSSIVTRPDELAAVWHGCGGSEKNSSASVTLSVSWNLTCGDRGLHLENGCTQDKSSPLATESLPVGALRLAAWGYFSRPGLAPMSCCQHNRLCWQQK
ncbi:hypothetical protein FJZ31_38300 [Candidatus Poribacteria bacterium]|nr:hypothetical protein [Candidatus Poribacteria bacterium]